MLAKQERMQGERQERKRTEGRQDGRRWGGDEEAKKKDCAKFTVGRKSQ